MCLSIAVMSIQQLSLSFSSKFYVCQTCFCLHFKQKINRNIHLIENEYINSRWDRT